CRVPSTAAQHSPGKSSLAVLIAFSDLHSSLTFSDRNRCWRVASSALVRRSPELTQRSEYGTDLLAKKLRLFPRGKATAAPSFAGIRLLTEAVALPARPLWA